MTEQKRLAVWQMVSEAVRALGGQTTNVAVRDWILDRYANVNRSTIQCQIISCTVNHHSRVHYPGNQKPRKCNGPYDFLFRPARGKLELYDPSRHGEWEIAEEDDGSTMVRQVDDSGGGNGGSTGGGGAVPSGSTFAAERHLRDYLVQHLSDIEAGLELYVDDNGTDGVEFRIDVGQIDILTVDASGQFVVVELKVAQGPDCVCGQLMRYMSWVKRHMADGRSVRGIIIAHRITDKIRYALADVEGVELKEYDLSLKLRSAEPLDQDRTRDDSGS